MAYKNKLNLIPLNNTCESFKKGGAIHIKKSHEGKFTDYCGGKVTDACIARAKASGNKKLIKRAVFALNARKWKHLNGGLIKAAQGTVITELPNSEQGNDSSEKVLKRKMNALYILQGIGNAAIQGANTYFDQKSQNSLIKALDSQIEDARMTAAKAALQKNLNTNKFSTPEEIYNRSQQVQQAYDAANDAIQKKEDILSLYEDLHLHDAINNAGAAVKNISNGIAERAQDKKEAEEEALKQALDSVNQMNSTINLVQPVMDQKIKDMTLDLVSKAKQELFNSGLLGINLVNSTIDKPRQFDYSKLSPAQLQILQTYDLLPDELNASKIMGNILDIFKQY